MIVVETFRRTSIVVGPEFVKFTLELEREALIPVELKLTASAKVGSESKKRDAAIKLTVTASKPDGK